MSTITDYFEQAELSLAAYALNLQHGMFGADSADYVAALVDGGMPQTQAEEFASTYRVLAQSPETGFLGNGFSATVFQNVETGERMVAIRGSERDLNDWFGTNFDDIGSDGIAISQGIALFNWLQRLGGASSNEVVQYVYHPGRLNPITNQYEPPFLTTTTAIASGELSGQIAPMTITGHSLGGHLAMIMSRLVPGMVNSVYTYNAPGFDTVFGTPFSPLTSEGFFDLLRNAPIGPITGAIGTAWNSSIMTHFAVQGDIVHTVGSIPGTHQIIFSESANQGIVDAHLIEPLTDSLALYDLIATLDAAPSLDPAFDVAAITDILKASASDAGKSLEHALDALRKIVQGPNLAATLEDNRDQFYQNYYALKESSQYQVLTGNALVRKLVGQTQADLQTLANTADPDGLAYRYALKELNPFALHGADYAFHNAQGELEQYDPATRTGTLTDEWIKDRSAFLVNKITANTADQTRLGVAYVSYDGSPQYFNDLASGDRLFLTSDPSVIDRAINNASTADISNIRFGGSSPDDLTGSDKWDKLYGMDGNDLLFGVQGDDYLEGGKGLDIYYYRPGDGNDTVVDQDGKGLILYGQPGQEQTLMVGLRNPGDPGGRYKSPDNTITFQINGADLTLTFPDGQTITIKNFDRTQTDLNIRLIDLPADAVGATLLGTAGNNTSATDGSVNPYEPGGNQHNDPSVGDLIASADTAAIYGLGGHDTLIGNHLPGEYLNGGEGHDIVDDGDQASGSGGQLYGESGNDSFDISNNNVNQFMKAA